MIIYKIHRFIDFILNRKIYRTPPHIMRYMANDKKMNMLEKLNKKFESVEEPMGIKVRSGVK